MTIDMLTAALETIGKGFAVFPVCWPNGASQCGCGRNHQGRDIGKVPMTKHGLKDATLDKDLAARYWKYWPKANIGITISEGHFVLDIDVAHGGFKSLEKLQADHGNLPHTLSALTGGGGAHQWFKANDIRNTVQLAGYPGIDIRGVGGYVVAPPSLHISGHEYTWLDDSPIVEAPMWLTDLCTAKTPVSIAGAESPIPEGQRNQTLASLAGTMRRRGMPLEAIEAALLQVNLRQCNPPLADKDVQAIAQSVARYQPDPIAQFTDKSDITDIVGVDTDKSDITDNQGKTLTSLTTTDIPLTSTDMGKAQKLVWRLVDDYLEYHKGETFSLDTICAHLDIHNRELRHSIVKKLSYEVERGKVTKSLARARALYTLVNKEIKIIDWINSTDDIRFPIQWPYSHPPIIPPPPSPLPSPSESSYVGDGSRFGFDGAVEIYAGDVIVIAGVSNTGKTALIINLVAENMDRIPIRLQGNEYSGGKFRYRLSHLTWANPLKDDGTSKFELIERHDNWADVIKPDALNIIDWLNLDGTLHPFYEIGSIIEGMQRKVGPKGILVVCIQKDPNKELGMGGGFGQHLASLYLVVDFLPDKSLRLTVKKAKAWRNHNPNHEMYGFELVEAGTVFQRIRRIEKCFACGGRGVQRTGAQCEACLGSGHLDCQMPPPPQW